MRPSAIVLSVGPSDLEAGYWDFGIEAQYLNSDYDEQIASGGWASRMPNTQFRASQVVAYVRRHMKLPKAVRAVGLSWNDADISPIGYNGAGDSRVGNSGIRLTWMVK